MADTYKVDVLKQAVFHDGKSMVVLSPVTKKNPKPVNPEVESRFIAKLVEEGAIKAPAGWRDPLDHDGNGEKGGSNPAEPPALAGKNKAQLLEIANDEGVTVADDATNAQIVEVIEKARDAKANPPAEPPALEGKTSDELRAIAHDEAVEIEEGASDEDVVSAIQLAREEKAIASGGANPADEAP